MIITNTIQKIEEFFRDGIINKKSQKKKQKDKINKIKRLRNKGGKE